MSNRPPGPGIHVALVSCYPPSTGPLSEYSYHLAQEYARDPRISKVTIIGDVVSKVVDDPRGKIEVYRSWKLDSPVAPFSIIRKLMKVRPDVVHFNILFRQFSSRRFVNFLGLTTPTMVRSLGIPVVVTLHSLAEGLDVREVGYSNAFVNRLGYNIATRLLLRVDAITVPHSHFIKILRQKYRAGNAMIVPHGVFFQPTRDLQFSGKRLLLFGKIGPYKNPGIALTAFSQVFSKDNEVELLIAGSSHPFHQEFLDSATRSKDLTGVRFTGYVPEDRLEEIFGSAVAVLLPYTTPTWSSGTFTLASAFGRPVIASDLPDFRELAQEGAGVILFPNGDTEALAKKMEDVVHDRGMQERLGEANLAWARKHRFEDVAHTLVNLLCSTVATDRPKGTSPN